MIICNLPLLLLSCLLVAHPAESWTYAGSKHWGGVCETGKAQSPINIQMKKVRIAKTEPLVFIKYNELYHYEVTNNGHSVRIDIGEPACIIGVTGGDLRAFYILDHIHFHWRAEHLIEGKRKPMEAHFVHYRNDLGNVSNAMNHPAGLAVLGVLFDVSEEDNPVLNDIIPYMTNSSEPVTPQGHISLADLIPTVKSGIYRYRGSLTTPPCSETVIWTVFKDTLPISKAQIKQLMNINFNGERENWRPEQPLNGRRLQLLIYMDIHSCAGLSEIKTVMCLLLSFVVPRIPYY